ncbi:MAG: hypothetical protein WBG81_12730 [Rhodanobacter sp.]
MNPPWRPGDPTSDVEQAEGAGGQLDAAAAAEPGLEDRIAFAQEYRQAERRAFGADEVLMEAGSEAGVPVPMRAPVRQFALRGA